MAVKFGTVEKFPWNMVPVARCDPGPATADPTPTRLPQVEFSALSSGCRALMAPEGSWKNIRLEVSLVRIRLMDEFGRITTGAGFWTEGTVSIPAGIARQRSGSANLVSYPCSRCLEDVLCCLQHYWQQCYWNPSTKSLADH